MYERYILCRAAFLAANRAESLCKSPPFFLILIKKGEKSKITTPKSNICSYISLTILGFLCQYDERLINNRKESVKNKRG
jgi:hypothetical protein